MLKKICPKSSITDVTSLILPSAANLTYHTDRICSDNKSIGPGQMAHVWVWLWQSYQYNIKTLHHFNDKFDLKKKKKSHDTLTIPDVNFWIISKLFCYDIRYLWTSKRETMSASHGNTNFSKKMFSVAILFQASYQRNIF